MFSKNHLIAVSISFSFLFSACESNANAGTPESSVDAMNKTFCGQIQKSIGMTVSEFDKVVKELKGKSRGEVVKALGKPKDYSTADGGKAEYFSYAGVKDDKITNILSYDSRVSFKDHKLEARTSHSFRDCGQSLKSTGKTIDEFDEIIKRLDGKPKDAVIAVLGKPTEYGVGGDSENFDYVGVKDPITGKFSDMSRILFTKNKLDGKRGVEHSFE